MQDGCRIFGNGKSSKTTNKNQHHKFPSGLGYPKPEGRDEGESYTLFRTLPFLSLQGEEVKVKNEKTVDARAYTRVDMLCSILFSVVRYLF